MGIDLKLHGDKVFGLYKTFHTNKEAHGVGLFLVKTQIESQGGNILIDSEPGKGTTFKIVF
jgi:sensor histidine kinase regulating citrate/malate metabolism